MLLIVGSNNPRKREELVRLLAGLPVTVKTLRDYPGTPAVTEDGATFEANARKKALTWAAALGVPVLADDSGLEVDALGGRPGVFSARFAGDGAGDAANTARLLREMADVPDGKRTARFRCVVAMAGPGGGCRTAAGVVEGVILRAPRGANGFGYDPVFEYPPAGKTFAELPDAEKDAISHRRRAIEGILPEIRRMIGE
ncbi:MAG: XTP/dITP diphosphatase [Planctomycetota bacterium]